MNVMARLEQMSSVGRIFHLLHEKQRSGWKIVEKEINEHARILETEE